MSRRRYSAVVTIAGHKYEDKDYLLGHVSPMFEELFDKPLRAHLERNTNSMTVYAWSKRVASTLNSWGMPFGYKKLATLVPTKEVKETCFIRGLFDTDGCVYRKYGPYRQLQFKFVSDSLLTFLRHSLVRLGFHPTSIGKDDTKFRFFISRQAEIDRFFEVIEPKNAKHLKRFRSFSRREDFRKYVFSIPRKS